MTDSANIFSGGGSAGPTGGDEFTRLEHTVDPEVPRIGKYRGKQRSVYPFDLAQGRLMPAVSWGATSNRVVSQFKAVKLFDDLTAFFGFLRAEENVLLAFRNGLFLAHALNGASVLTPGRASFYVNGEEYSYAEALKVLADDARRFFRYYADDVSSVIVDLRRRVMFSETITDDQQVSFDADSWATLLWIADERGLTGRAELVHDSADAMSTLTVSDRALLLRAKKPLIAQVNAADYTKMLMAQDAHVSGESSEFVRESNSGPRVSSRQI